MRGGIDLNLSETVMAAFDRHRQRARRDPERGGILMGQVSEDFSTVLVTHLTVPGPHDRSTRTTFYRHGGRAQRLAEREFVASGGQVVYLGEWHTHPATHARPSVRDRTMIHEQFEANTLCTPYLLLVVVALNDLYLGLFDGKRLWP